MHRPLDGVNNKAANGSTLILAAVHVVYPFVELSRLIKAICQREISDYVTETQSCAVMVLLGHTKCLWQNVRIL